MKVIFDSRKGSDCYSDGQRIGFIGYAPNVGAVITVRGLEWEVTQVRGDSVLVRD